MVWQLSAIFVLAFLLDAVFGDPPNRFHPVCLMGWWASRIEARYRARLGNGFAVGMLAALSVAVPFAAIVVFALWFAEQFGGSMAAVVGAALVLYICFAPKGLALHARQVSDALKGNDPEQARECLSLMVGRDTSTLDTQGIVKACVESVAENITDGVVSPIFWTAIGAAVGGFCGAAAAVAFYRSVNTLDSMWGKRNDRYRRFGTFAARLDDVLNFVPARFCWLAVSFAAALFRLRFGKALRIGLRDRGNHESPNSAWTEATFAGALGIQLGGHAVYEGQTVAHPVIGDAIATPEPKHISVAIGLMWGASVLFAAACLGVFWIMKMTIYTCTNL